MKKADDVEVKANLQLLFYIREIDSRCPKDHLLLVKKNNKDIYWKPHNETSKDKDKAKPYNSSPTS